MNKPAVSDARAHCKSGARSCGGCRATAICKDCGLCLNCDGARATPCPARTEPINQFRERADRYAAMRDDQAPTREDDKNG